MEDKLKEFDKDLGMGIAIISSGLMVTGIVLGILTYPSVTTIGFTVGALLSSLFIALPFSFLGSMFIKRGRNLLSDQLLENVYLEEHQEE